MKSYFRLLRTDTSYKVAYFHNGGKYGTVVNIVENRTKLAKTLWSARRVLKKYAVRVMNGELNPAPVRKELTAQQKLDKDIFKQVLAQRADCL